MHLIKREKYLARVRPFIRKNLVKVLVGARRSGKTYILYQLIEEIKESDKNSSIIYINKEQHEFRPIMNDEHLFRYVNNLLIPEKNNYVFIDEVQEIEKFEMALRELSMKGCDIYCTGSNARMLSGDLATHLSGRYIEIPVYGLSYSEFIQFHHFENTRETLLKYIRYGGMPYLIHLEMTDEIIYDYLKNIFNTIILKDVVARFNIREVDFLNRLSEYIANNLGSLVSSKKITEYLKSQHISLSINTVLNYLQYLCQAFYIDKIPRYDITGKKIFEVNDKFYFRDLGLKHAMVPYRPNDFGKILENLIYNQLIFEGYSVYIGKLGNKEIDFVAHKKDEVLYIQSTYLLANDEVIDREFGNLLEIPDNYRKIVVSVDDYALGNYKGIEHKHILDFLIQK